MIDQVRPSGLAAWIAVHSTDGAKALVLDVREPAELRVASVTADASFELREIPMMEIPARLAELDPERPTAILCHHGNRSQRVAMFLAGNGFSCVSNIAGGIEAWSQELDTSVPRY